MNGFLAPHLAARNLDRAVGDHFVHVHVGLRTRPGLPNAQREVSFEFARDHLVGSGDDQLGFIVGEFTEIAIDERGGFLERGHRADDLTRHHVAGRLSVPYIEVNQRARRLRAIIFIAGDLDLAHGVGLGACLHAPIFSLGGPVLPL